MLPPHELQKKDFTRVIRGYNSAEVDEHIEFIIEKYAELYRRNDELERELRTTKAQLDELKANEDAIRRAMVNAQRAEHKIVTEASERADLIMRTAKHNCDRVLVDFKNKIRDERITLHKLRSAVAQFKENTLRQYQVHLEYIEQISPNIEGEPEWEMTEDEYTERLLEQMKLDIAGSVRSSFTEEDDPESAPVETKKAEEKEKASDIVIASKAKSPKAAKEVKDKEKDDSDVKIAPDLISDADIEAEERSAQATMLFDAVSFSMQNMKNDDDDDEDEGEGEGEGEGGKSRSRKKKTK